MICDLFSASMTFKIPSSDGLLKESCIVFVQDNLDMGTFSISQSCKYLLVVLAKKKKNWCLCDKRNWAFKVFGGNANL